MKVSIKKEVEVRYLKAECNVRYWEDCRVNGKEDTDGDLIPMRSGDIWEILIDLDFGIIIGWPNTVEADVHYKVVDSGKYTLLDSEKSFVSEIDGYVPGIMCPGDDGYGDYVIMKIGKDGVIQDFDFNNNLEEWQDLTTLN